MTRAQDAERAEAIARLHEYVKPGDTVYCVLRHRAASGMFRVIQLVKITDGDRYYLGYNAAAAMQDRYDRDREGIAVRGAGMDMGFHLVYNLGATLWPDGFACTGAGCHSNDHSNGQPFPHDFPTTTYSPDNESRTRAVDPAEPCPVYRCGRSAADHPTQPEHHRDGGYALRSEWL